MTATKLRKFIKAAKRVYVYNRLLGDYTRIPKAEASKYAASITRGTTAPKLGTNEFGSLFIG